MDASEPIPLIADTALTPSGWRHDVLLQTSASGHFASVAPATDAVSAKVHNARRVRGVVLPALPNLHSHAFQRGLVGRTERRAAPASDGGQPDDFWSWRHAMYAFLQQLDPDAIEDIATLVYSEMLRAGYGSVAEFHYLHRSREGSSYDDPFELSRRMIRAAERSGIRLTLVPVVYECGGFGGVPLGPAQRRFAFSADEAIRAAEVLVADSGRQTHTVGIGLHSLRAASPQAVADVSAWASSHAATPVHIHIAEQVAEVEACIAWSGARPVNWLLDHAPLDRRWCLVHATHLEDSERVRLADSGAVVGLCPTTEANLGDGIFGLAPFEAASGTWGIGSDSQVSVSPAEELRTLEYGQRLSGRTRVVAGRSGPSELSNGRALVESCLEGGSRAMGQPVGRLETGACADLVVLDTEHPRLLGLDGDAILDAWILGSGQDAVRDVMVAGRWVVQDGLPLGWDDTVAAYRRTLSRLG